MNDNFDRCLAHVLKHEGGYVDHPDDPGGATNYGITIHTLSDWLQRPATKADVKALTADVVAAIYRGRYWLQASCDRLPAGVDLMVFDSAVNSGVSRATRWLQQAVGATADGIVGPKTLDAVEARDTADTIRDLSRIRGAYYRSLRTFKTFGRGWMRRLGDVTETALDWVRL
jgi:lysozyme family protein